MSRSSLRWVRRGAITLAALLVAGFAVGSLAGSKGAAKDSSASVKHSRSPATEKLAAPPGTGGSLGTLDASSGPPAIPQPAPAPATLGGLVLPPAPSTVIKTGDVAIRVARNRLDGAFNRVVAIAGKYGGYLLSSSQGGPVPVPQIGKEGIEILPPAPAPSGEDRTSDIVLRIPADRFEKAVADLTNGDIGSVTRRGFSGQDVGQEFVDLEARLRNERAQEAILLKLMSKATTIGETISVQQQLSQVQGQIEEITGRIQYLKSQTQFATVSVHLFEGTGAAAGSGGPSLSKAWRTAVQGLQRMGTAALIGATWLSPFLVLGLGWVVSRRFRTRPAVEA